MLFRSIEATLTGTAIGGSSLNRLGRRRPDATREVKSGTNANQEALPLLPLYSNGRPRGGPTDRKAVQDTRPTSCGQPATGYGLSAKVDCRQPACTSMCPPVCTPTMQRQAEEHLETRPTEVQNCPNSSRALSTFYRLTAQPDQDEVRRALAPTAEATELLARQSKTIARFSWKGSSRLSELD